MQNQDKISQRTARRQTLLQNSLQFLLISCKTSLAQTTTNHCGGQLVVVVSLLCLWQWRGGRCGGGEGEGGRGRDGALAGVLLLAMLVLLQTRRSFRTFWTRMRAWPAVPNEDEVCGEYNLRLLMKSWQLHLHTDCREGYLFGTHIAAHAPHWQVINVHLRQSRQLLLLLEGLSLSLSHADSERQLLEGL